MNEELTTLEDIKNYLYGKPKRIFPFDQLNEIARRILATCPHAGQGVHDWIFHASSIFWNAPFGLPEEKIIRLMERVTANCGRTLEPHEIPDAVRNSCPYNFREASDSKPVTRTPMMPRPQANQAYINRIVKSKACTLADVIAKSPLPGEGISPLQALAILFPDKPLLALAKDKYSSFAVKWDDPKLCKLSLANFPQFLVPNPLKAEHGYTQKGKKSARSADNIAQRVYLVIEWDKKSDSRKYNRNEQASLLWFLANTRWGHLLTMVVFSGKRSLHCWFYVKDLPEVEVQALCAVASKIGADPATFNKCWLVRMPGAKRKETKKIQEIYYLNPNVIKS
jgi:hypothetical protein